MQEWSQTACSEFNSIYINAYRTLALMCFLCCAQTAQTRSRIECGPAVWKFIVYTYCYKCCPVSITYIPMPRPFHVVMWRKMFCQREGRPIAWISKPHADELCRGENIPNVTTRFPIMPRLWRALRSLATASMPPCADLSTVKSTTFHFFLLSWKQIIDSIWFLWLFWFVP